MGIKSRSLFFPLRLPKSFFKFNKMKKSREFLCSAGKNQGSFEIIMCQNLYNRQQNHPKKKAKLIICIFLNRTRYYKNSILKK